MTAKMKSRLEGGFGAMGAMLTMSILGHTGCLNNLRVRYQVVLAGLLGGLVALLVRFLFKTFCKEEAGQAK